MTSRDSCRVRTADRFPASRKTWSAVRPLLNPWRIHRLEICDSENLNLPAIWRTSRRVNTSELARKVAIMNHGAAKTFIQMILITAAITSSFGCAMATSRPLYDAKRTNVVYDPRLIGRWVNNNGSLQFSRGDGNSYRIEGISEPARATDGPRLAAQMVRISKYYYLFFAEPDQAGRRDSGCPQVSELPVTPEELRLQPVNASGCASDLRHHPGVTAPTDPIRPIPTISLSRSAGRNPCLNRCLRI